MPTCKYLDFIWTGQRQKRKKICANCKSIIQLSQLWDSIPVYSHNYWLENVCNRKPFVHVSCFIRITNCTHSFHILNGWLSAFVVSIGNVYFRFELSSILFLGPLVWKCIQTQEIRHRQSCNHHMNLLLFCKTHRYRRRTTQANRLRIEHDRRKWCADIDHVVQ